MHKIHVNGKSKLYHETTPKKMRDKNSGFKNFRGEVGGAARA